MRLIPSKQVDTAFLKAAKGMFKEHKVVVMTGPAGSGKTQMAVALAASYHPSYVLLLTYPELVQYVDHNIIHLVIIEEFTGKYEYNKTNICNWYKTFDLLYAMKSAGNLNIIITCDKQKLEKCYEEIAPHSLMGHTVVLHPQSVLVKQEISNTNVNQAQTVTAETVSIREETDYSGRESSLNLSAKRFTSVVSTEECEECISLRSIVNLDFVDCTSICLTKDKSKYGAVT